MKNANVRHKGGNVIKSVFEFKKNLTLMNRICKNYHCKNFEKIYFKTLI